MFPWRVANGQGAFEIGVPLLWLAGGFVSVCALLLIVRWRIGRRSDGSFGTAAAEGAVDAAVDAVMDVVTDPW